MSSQQEYSSGGESHHSQPSSLGRKVKAKGQKPRQHSKQSLLVKVVDPAKKWVTEVIKKAEQLLVTGAATQYTLSNTLSEDNSEIDGHQDTLKTADTVLIDLKRYVHKLTSLYNYVELSFDTPLMNASLDKERYLEEAYTLIAKAKPHELATQLQELVFALEASLLELGFQFTSFTPSDDYDSEPIDAMEHRSKAICENNGVSNEPLLVFQPSNHPARDLALERKIMEMEEEVKRLQLQLENQQKQAILKEQKSSSKVSELESWHSSEHASIQHEQQARVNTSGYFSGTSVYSSDRLQNPDTIRAGRPTTQHTGQTRAGIPTTQNTDQVRASRLTTEAIPEQTLNSATASESFSKAMFEMLQKMHEEKMRSNTELRDNIAEILNNQNNQRERERADSYADQYEYAFSGAEDPRSGERQADSGSFSTSGNSHHEHSNIQPPQMYQMSPYERKFDPTKYLLPYNGTGDLEQFQHEFDTYVTQDTRFTVNDRYLILRKVLTGQALQCLNRSQDSQEAIDKTFALLQNTFGNNQTQASLLRKLLNLPFHQSDSQKMRQDLATIITVLEQLYHKGIPQNDARTISDIVRKLPLSIRRGVCEFMVGIGEGITHDQVLEQIYSKIAVLDMDKNVLSQGNELAMDEIYDSFGEINLIKASGTSKAGRKSTVHSKKSQAAREVEPKEKDEELPPLAYVKESHPSRFIDPITGKALEGYYAPGTNYPDLRMFHRTFPFQKPEKTQCLVCEGPHNVIRCTLTSTAFRKISKAKKLCPICASKHSIQECRSQTKCGYCGGTHHLGGCPQKEFYRKPENYPAGAKDRAHIFCADDAKITPQ